MRTFEIGRNWRNDKNSFTLYVRNYDGVEVNNLPVVKLTNEEASALFKCGFVNPSLIDAEDIVETDIDPKTLLVCKEINLMARWPDADPIMGHRLVLILSENAELKREACELVDPWFEDNPGNLREAWGWLQNYCSDETASFLPKPDQQDWPDNPCDMGEI